MIIKIDAWERDNFERSCAIYGATVSFFTIESNPLMLQAEIKSGGKEPSLSQMYIIGRDTAGKRFEDRIINNVKTE